MPLTSVRLRPGRPADAEAVEGLIARWLPDLLLDPRGHGAEVFLASVSVTAERGYLSDPRYRFWLAETADGALAGFIALRDARHVFHLFVARDCQRQGVARRLWACAQAEAGAATVDSPYTVNASLSAVPVYRAFGFELTGPVVQQHGIAFQPMRCLRTNAG